MILKPIFFVVLNFVTVVLLAQTTPWEVPADRNSKLSTAEFTDQNRNTGKDLYQTNCKSCHGDPGKNNIIKLVPPPPDPAAIQLQQNTDGSLHYKISEGRGAMPSFKNVLNSADIWNIIAFLRTFNKDYRQQLAVKPTFGGELFDKVELKLIADQSNTTITAQLTGIKGALVKPISGLEVKLFAVRYFGNLIVDKPMDTNIEGKALFACPKNLPGDASGNISLIAQLSNEDLFGLVKTESTMTIGLPTDRPPLNEPRALWNVVRKTPIWLLVTYLASVLIVWGFIVVVLLKLRTISKLGE
ncbi:MAG: c-type cytochrome [Prolixibacteraceae bacterium]|jgi:mono/diheme cytochrome c family protein|nr:c-type cytochrome [Prolixibacteraceae bacterium]